MADTPQATEIDFSQPPTGAVSTAATPEIDFTTAPTGPPPVAPAEQQFPLSQLPGEPYDVFMQRVSRKAKQLAPEQMQTAEANVRDPQKVATVLGTAAVAPFAFPALAMTPEMASAAVGGGIAGGAAAGATGGAEFELLRQAVTGENPISKEGAVDLLIATGLGAGTGGVLAGGGKLLGWAGGKLLDSVGSKASDLWDMATGYRKALDIANDALKKAHAAYPEGQLGEWAKTNEVLSVPMKSVRVSYGGESFGNPGRGLEKEGISAYDLQQMKPPDIVRTITPRLQAAGKAVQATADEATAKGITLDGGNQAHQVIKGIKDPQLQDKAIEMFNQHTRDLDIHDVRNMTPSEVLQLRQSLKADANFGAIQPNLGTKLYRAVSQDLHDGVPDLVPVDLHYGDLTSAMRAAQNQTSKYLIGKWTPPLTRIQKAEAALPSREEFNKEMLTKGLKAVPYTLPLGAASGLAPALAGRFFRKPGTP